MEFFVEKGSVVREIWGKGDTVLFIFAGASAEFALNKAVDWLYFTGRLPADPLGRLFSTVEYARQIVFSEREAAVTAIRKIVDIHKHVEHARGATIPAWAYRDVLFMLIYYSISSFELMERKLTEREKNEVYKVFYRLGLEMHLTDLPKDYNTWLPVRKEHLQQDLLKSDFTIDLYKQYKKNLGSLRYKLLLEGQILVVPHQVNQLLGLGKASLLKPVLAAYKFARKLGLGWLLKSAVLPPSYRKQIRALDATPA
jgi:hypothetical protein